MKLRDYLLPLLFAIAGVWVMNYFFPRQQVVVSGGQRVTTQQEPVEIKPLNKEIDFTDKSETRGHQLTEIQTAHGTVVFSTEGASLQAMNFERMVDGKSIELTTLTPPTDVEREKRFLLVALDEKTPYFYTLEERRDEDRISELTYRASSGEAVVEKKYTVYKDLYKIDLELTIKPRRAVQPRIFFAAPALVGLEKTAQIAGIVEENAALVKMPQRRSVRELNDNFWQRPTLFGAEDRYFVNALVADANQFAQRGYYKVEGDTIYPIIEGPTIDKETTWKLSFYCGPKEQAAMAAVDPRLDAVLDFGWLAPISKAILWLLLLMNAYVHNFGLAIVVMAILIRLLLMPFSFGAAQRAEKMSEMNKKMQYIRHKYKDDPEQLRREQEELYKKYGIAGMGVAGCLPNLLQIPMFFAMNRVLSSSIDLYQASFLWIPDLSAKDPWYILPLLTGLSTFYMIRSQATDTQQRVTGTIMAIVSSVFLAGVFAGLSLYFFVSNSLAVAQIVIQKQFRRG